MIDARRAEAVEDALLAFWAVIAAQYPEARSGDLDVGSVVTLEIVADKVVETWLRYNIPTEATDE